MATINIKDLPDDQDVGGDWKGVEISPTFGGTGVSNPTAHGLLIGEGASPFTSLVLTNGQIPIGVTGSDPISGGTFSQYTRIIYVSNTGNDSTGNGTLINPYLTIAHALSLISPTNTTATLLVLMSVVFSETSLASALPPNVSLYGQYNVGATIVTSSGNISLVSGYASIGSNACFTNINFAKPLVFDLSASAFSPSQIIKINNCILGVDGNHFLGSISTNQNLSNGIEINNSLISGSLQLTNLSAGANNRFYGRMFNCNIFSPITVDQTTSNAVITGAFIKDCYFSNASADITLSAVAASGDNYSRLRIINSCNSSNIVLNSSNSYFDIDDASYPHSTLNSSFSSGIINTGSSTVRYLSDISNMRSLWTGLFNPTSGVSFISNVVVATTANLNATYNNGSFGVGATLTNAGTQAVFSLDGFSTIHINSLILVKDQNFSTNNGLYYLSTVGSASTNWVLTRSPLFDTPSKIINGSLFFVQNGSINSGRIYVFLNGIDPMGIGVNSMRFSQWSGNEPWITILDDSQDDYTLNNGQQRLSNNQIGTDNYKLPLTAKVGSQFQIVQMPASLGFIVNQNANQYIRMDVNQTTIGLTGTLGTLGGVANVITIICVEEDIAFQVVSSVGAFSLT